MISALIREIEETVSTSLIVVSSNIHNFFSATRKQAYIRGTLTFIDLSYLEFAIYVEDKGKKLIFDRYRFQYMDPLKKLIFRYDNAPHFKDIPTFPDHKHLKDGRVIGSTLPRFPEILEEISTFLARS
jgi:hypothetical protein